MTVTRQQFVEAAMAYAGTPYRHLGRLPGVALDCAGLVWCAFRECGLVMPEPQYGMLPTISGLEGELQKIADQRSVAIAEPGDLISTIYHGTLGHVAIYLGDGMVLQALARRGGTVRVTRMVAARAAWAVRGMV